MSEWPWPLRHRGAPRPVGAALLALLLATAGLGSGAAAAPLPGAGEANPYRIVRQDVRQALADFGSGLGIPVAVGDGVDGEVRQLAGIFTPEEFLDRLAADQGLSWYFDGRTLHVTPAALDGTLILDLDGVPIGDVERTLAELGLLDPRYPLMVAEGGKIARVSGPPRYLDAVREAVGAVSVPAAAPGTAPVQVIQGRERTMVPTGN